MEEIFKLAGIAESFELEDGWKGLPYFPTSCPIWPLACWQLILGAVWHGKLPRGQQCLAAHCSKVRVQKPYKLQFENRVV